MRSTYPWHVNLLLAVCPSPASTAESTFPIPPLPSYSIHEQFDPKRKMIDVDTSLQFWDNHCVSFMVNPSYYSLGFYNLGVQSKPWKPSVDHKYLATAALMVYKAIMDKYELHIHINVEI